MSARISCVFALCGIVCALSCGGDATSATPVASIRFLTLPDTLLRATEPFTVSIELLGANGERAAGANDAVAIALDAGTPMVGPSSVRAANGLATFEGIVLNKAQSALVFHATSGTLTADSPPFGVRAGAVSAAMSSYAPAAVSIPANEPTQFVFTFRDGAGNPLERVRVKFTSTNASDTFSPDTGMTTATGVDTTVFKTTATASTTIKANVDGVDISFAPLGTCAPAAYAFPGFVAASVVANMCMSNGRATALYKFTLPAPAGVSFSVTSAFTPALEVRTDPVSDNVVAFPGQNSAAEWLLPAGVFNLRLGATTAGGAFTITGTTVPANSGCTTRLIVTSGTYTGQRLGSGDCVLSDGSWTDRFAVYSRGGCAFDMRSTQYVVYMFLYDAITNEFLDGRGGGDPGDTEHLGLSHCNNTGHPLTVWALSDAAGIGGTYTLTATLLPVTAGVRAGSTAVFKPFPGGVPGGDVSVMRIKAALLAARIKREAR